MKIKQLTIADITVHIEALPEDMPVVGNVGESGNKDQDLAVENSILRRLDRGDIWAWCMVQITCTYKMFTTTELITGCNYASEADFKSSGSYTDIVEICLAKLQKQVNELVKEFVIE